jgi:hypothetical protein
MLSSLLRPIKDDGLVLKTPGVYSIPCECGKVRGVFKKRPNFLNSVPTGAESVLRLLSAPSGRF